MKKQQHNFVSKVDTLLFLEEKGFLVPKTVKLNTKVLFESFFTDDTFSHLQTIIEELKVNAFYGIEKQLSLIQRMLLNCQLKESKRKEYTTIYTEMIKQSNNHSLAIRSSGSFEDEQHASHAGIHESYIDVQGFEQFIEGIKLCWVSSFSEVAVTYRKIRNIDVIDENFCVFIQPFIRSSYNGVMYSKSPIDNNDFTPYVSVSKVSEGITDGSDVFFDGRLLALREEKLVPTILLEKLEENLQRLMNVYTNSMLDIEWLLEDNNFYILQVRQLSESMTQAGPRLLGHDLCVIDIDCYCVNATTPSFIKIWLQKRKQFRQLVNEFNPSVLVKAYVVCVCKDTLESLKTAFTEQLNIRTTLVLA